MTKRCHVVLTTIFVPRVLEDLYANAERHGRLDDVKVWIVGDRKTPAEARELCRDVASRGLEAIYYGIDDQDAWGRRFGAFYSRIPYDNETRRNLGYLRALEDGCELLLSMDDDNFPTEQDFFGGHLRTGNPVDGPLLHEPSGYHNVCEHLEIEPRRALYPRGFPFRLRGQSNAPSESAAPADARVGVMAGMWLQEPDIDATTWLNGKVRSLGYTGPPRCVLRQDTWTPINTQNTSVVRELIPAFMCVPMGHEVPGGKIQRYGDIWGGYVLQAVMRDTPFHVAFGHPLVEHQRNPHDYVDDLRHEFWGMILTDWIVGLMRSDLRPAGTSITGRVREVAEFLDSTAVPRAPGWCPPQMLEFLRSTAESLRQWAAVCEALGA
jgi:hypothetical protein